MKSNLIVYPPLSIILSLPAVLAVPLVRAVHRIHVVLRLQESQSDQVRPLLLSPLVNLPDLEYQVIRDLLADQWDLLVLDLPDNRLRLAVRQLLENHAVLSALVVPVFLCHPTQFLRI